MKILDKNENISEFRIHESSSNLNKSSFISPKDEIGTSSHGHNLHLIPIGFDYMREIDSLADLPNLDRSFNWLSKIVNSSLNKTLNYNINTNSIINYFI